MRHARLRLYVRNFRSMITIRELSRFDFDHVAEFLSRQTGSSRDTIIQRLDWLSRNPALRLDIPLGIGAYKGETLCGTMLYIPTRFADGDEVQICVMSALFYVDQKNRGAGLPMFIKFRTLTKQYPVYAATANAFSASIWRVFGGVPIPGSDSEYIRVLHFDTVAEEILHWTARGLEALFLPQARNQLDQLHAIELTPASLADCLTDAHRSNPCGHFEVLRDSELLRWKIYESGQCAYRFCSQMSDFYCIFQHLQRGYRQQISCIEIRDVWGQLDPVDWPKFIASVRYSFNPDFIVVRGCSPLAQLKFTLRLFWKRRFNQTTGWLLDPKQLLRGRFLYSPLAGE
jgi:hypothetical protein